MTMIIGLTGGIASGKSTVVAMLRQVGYQVIDADQVVHDLQAKGGALYQALVSWLGDSILQADGELNRSKLGQLIFSDDSYRQKSAQLQGEIIRQELAKKRDQLTKTEEIFFMDIPLLIESGYQDWFDSIWLVALSEDKQIQRLMQRNGLTREAAQDRIASQMSLADKLTYADLVLDNNGDLDALRHQVKQAIKEL